MPADVPIWIFLATEELVNTTVGCPMPFINTGEKERYLSLIIERVILCLPRLHLKGFKHFVGRPKLTRIRYQFVSECHIRQVKFHDESDIVLKEINYHFWFRICTYRYDPEIYAVDEMSLQIRLHEIFETNRNRCSQDYSTKRGDVTY